MEMPKHNVRDLQEYRAILGHVLLDPDLLIRAAAQRNMKLRDAYFSVLDEIREVDDAIALASKQEGVK